MTFLFKKKPQQWSFGSNFMVPQLHHVSTSVICSLAVTMHNQPCLLIGHLHFPSAQQTHTASDILKKHSPSLLCVPTYSLFYAVKVNIA